MKKLPFAILALLLFGFPAFVSAQDSEKPRAITDFEKVFADKLYKVGKETAGLEKVSLTPVDYYLVYASAKWCPPCRTFTPKLVEAYNKLKEASKVSFELVFMSSDQDETGQLDYMTSYKMPWLTLKLDEPEPQELLKALGQNVIPNLMVYDKEGKVVFTGYGEKGKGGAQGVLQSFVTLASPAEPKAEESAAKPKIEEGAAEPKIEASPAKPKIEEGAAKPKIEEGAAEPKIEEGVKEEAAEEKVEAEAEGESKTENSEGAMRILTGFEEVFADKLYKVDEKAEGLEKVSLTPVDYYLVYASAKWCPPCRAFTPKLVEAYNKLKEESKVSFELVFASSDQDEDAQLDYMISYKMPWLTLKRDGSRPDELLKALGQNAIPNLMVYDKEGEVVLSSYGEKSKGGAQGALREFVKMVEDMQ